MCVGGAQSHSGVVKENEGDGQRKGGSERGKPEKNLLKN